MTLFGRFNKVEARCETSGPKMLRKHVSLDLHLVKLMAFYITSWQAIASTPREQKIGYKICKTHHSRRFAAWPPPHQPGIQPAHQFEESCEERDENNHNTTTVTRSRPNHPDDLKHEWSWMSSPCDGCYRTEGVGWSRAECLSTFPELSEMLHATEWARWGNHNVAKDALSRTWVWVRQIRSLLVLNSGFSRPEGPHFIGEISTSIFLTSRLRPEPSGATQRWFSEFGPDLAEGGGLGYDGGSAWASEVGAERQVWSLKWR